jgi:hypothetical protein
MSQAPFDPSSHNEVLIAFGFPEVIRMPASTYLLGFVTFLRNLGLDTDFSLRDDSSALHVRDWGGKVDLCQYMRRQTALAIPSGAESENTQLYGAQKAEGHPAWQTLWPSPGTTNRGPEIRSIIGVLKETFFYIT